MGQAVDGSCCWACSTCPFGKLKPKNGGGGWLKGGRKRGVTSVLNRIVTTVRAVAKQQELPAAVKNRDSSYTVSKLRALSHRFRRQNRLIWQAFCRDEGDLGMVAVTQTCECPPTLWAHRVRTQEMVGLDM